MTRDVFNTIGCLFVVLLMMTSLLNKVSAADTDESSEVADSDYKNFDRLAQIVSNYMDSVREEGQRSDPTWQTQNLLDMALSGTDKRSFTSPVRKRLCKLGIFSEGCRLSDMDAAMRRQQYLMGGTSPGKRSDGDFTFDQDQPTATKRTCHLRLGGHCVTESLDKAAKQYWYLKSADSPGRRRRSAIATREYQASRKLSALRRHQRDVMDQQGR